jgi:hypothetical protein
MASVGGSAKGATRGEDCASNRDRDCFGDRDHDSDGVRMTTECLANHKIEKVLTPACRYAPVADGHAASSAPGLDLRRSSGAGPAEVQWIARP